MSAKVNQPLPGARTSRSALTAKPSPNPRADLEVRAPGILGRTTTLPGFSDARPRSRDFRTHDHACRQRRMPYPERKWTEEAGGFYSRGTLPHCSRERETQCVTFRLADSLPTSVLVRIREQADAEGANPEKAGRIRRRNIDRFLDQGYGACLLAREDIARVVRSALLHHDQDRYRLLAWVIMPNHVHALIELVGTNTLKRVVKTWKSFTARKANAALDRVGPFWQPDYHDRYVRRDSHLNRVVAYIEHNPVSAGLCRRPQDWSFSSASSR